jgi:hypothetical protein
VAPWSQKIILQNYFWSTRAHKFKIGKPLTPPFLSHSKNLCQPLDPTLITKPRKQKVEYFMGLIFRCVMIISLSDREINTMLLKKKLGYVKVDTFFNTIFETRYRYCRQYHFWQPTKLRASPRQIKRTQQTWHPTEIMRAKALSTLVYILNH